MMSYIDMYIKCDHEEEGTEVVWSRKELKRYYSNRVIMLDDVKKERDENVVIVRCLVVAFSCCYVEQGEV